MATDRKTGFDAITDPQAIDLSCHALVEASAGTGKTYTIENLVVRLLVEEADLQLENILLVTFTEKATGELKQRIRQKIEQTLDGDPGLCDAICKKLHESLDNFDNAPIFTIHGFCHTLLREFPFETGNLFEQELMDDPPLLEKLLRKQIRSDWPKRFGERLYELLALAHFPDQPDAFIDNIVQLALRLSGDASRETLIPDPGDTDVDALYQSIQTKVAALKALVGRPPALSEAYDRLNIHKGTRQKNIRELVVPLEQCLDQINENGWTLAPVFAFMQTLIPRSGLKSMPFDSLMPTKWLKAGENLDVCPHLNQIKDHVNELTQLCVTASHLLTLSALDQLRRDVRSVKDRHGWISYQDMLTRVADFLTAPGAEAGVEKIRARYRVAFVDEFQDTDDLQWRIFNRLFMEAGTTNRLFLIGDPKQAIYGFRGADIFTYLTARQTMVQLAAKKQAHLYRLNVNWRSVSAMVDGFNRIFGKDDWFGAATGKGPFEIGYPAADSPPEDALPLTLQADRSGRPALNVIDLSPVDSQLEAKDVLARFICREIRFLVHTAKIRIKDKKGASYPLNYSDIAILVRSQTEFMSLEARLIKSAIPYTYYRQPGLFQCPQAHLLSIMLKAVLNPQHGPTVKLALLTPFFDISPQTLSAWAELPADHLSQQLLDRWQKTAAKRRWGLLFQSLMEESGMIARHCTDPGWDRTRTNFQQLFDYLETTAYAKNMDAGTLVGHLDKLRLTGSASGADADIHQIEDEGDKVQILTMHVSKGLEFPVVFIAGGLTMRAFGGVQVYHSIDTNNPQKGCRKIVDLTGRSGMARARQEFEDEQKRLYYVALTRARAKVYVPFYPDDRNHGWIGPICTFVSRSIHNAFEPVSADRPPEGWLHCQAPLPTDNAVTDDAAMNRPSAMALPADRLIPAPDDFRHRKIALESFSSIGHRMSGGHGRFDPTEAFSLIDEIMRDDDEPATGLATQPVERHALDDLPGGTGMGSMFHHIFETIDFQAVLNGPADILEDDRLQRVVEDAMAHYRIDMRWAPCISRIVAQTLRRPIAVDDQVFRLGQLTPAQRRHEIEFYFPLAESFERSEGAKECGLDKGPCREMVVRGFIDLVFAWKDRFYIADWKSNRLSQGYRQDAMQMEMEAAGYDLQYQLYSLSTLRWLKQKMGDGFDPYRHFGGVFYLFIRGLDGQDQSDGVFHVPPAQLLPVEALEKTIRQRIARIHW
ncbi:RecB: exodeoxyribonuclease V, subunit beta [Desulfosarcina variabilis str. Montpellier]|uniref:UvrD-helicase domain-containing protein n=1 Tax=Desulfosarcina variabilis TaxID=2300 RepID=UPI003AFB69D2